MNNEQINTNVEQVSYECPSCGGNMTYDPAQESLHCKYCESTIKIDSIQSSEEYDFSEGLKEDQLWDSGKVIFHCKYCGADNIKNVNDLSSNCPFCGSDSVIKLEELPGIKPHRVIPFKISKSEAYSKFQTKLKKSFFAPKDLKKNFKEAQINGIFLPCWTYDSNCYTVYNGVLGKYYTVTVGSGKNRRTVTKVRYFRISGSKSFVFDDVIVTSGKALTNDQISGILPYKTNDAVVYDEAYLAGYDAEHYTITLKEGWAQAKNKSDQDMKRRILSQYHYDIVRSFNMNSSYSNIKYKYVLLPIWISYYKYKNKTYYFLVNGESGKVGGKSPVSALKVTILVLIILAIAALIFYLIYIGEGYNYPY